MAGTLREIPIELVDADPGQPRRSFDDEALRSLAATIRSAGVQTPIRVWRIGSRFRIIVGERRWRAALLAGLTEIPVIIEERELCAAEIAELQLIENCAREGLRPLEEARAIFRLIELTGMAAGEAARRIGRSPSIVSKLLALPTLSPKEQEYVESGAISLSGGYELAQIADPKERARLAEEMAAGRLTRDGLIGVRKAAARKARPRSRPSQRRERVVFRMGAAHTVTVCGPALAMDSVIACVSELFAALRSASDQGLAIKEVAERLGSK